MGDIMLNVHLKKKIGDISADIELHMERPQITVLFGRSGAGKSTFAGMLAGLLPPDEGRICFRGRCFYDSQRRINLPANKRGIGYVFQEHRLFPHITVRRNLTFANFPGRRGTSANFDDVVSLFELGRLLERYPPTLSGGESQRVALGRAILGCTSFLIMDEPLSSLDNGLKDVLLSYIAAIPRLFSFPLLYITHSREELEKLAESVLVIEKGKEKYFGSPKNFLSNYQNI